MGLLGSNVLGQIPLLQNWMQKVSNMTASEGKGMKTRAMSATVIRPWSSGSIKVHVPVSTSHRLLEELDSPSPGNLMVVPALVHPGESQVHVKVFNLSSSSVYVKKRTPLAQLVGVSEIQTRPKATGYKISVSANQLLVTASDCELNCDSD